MGFSCFGFMFWFQKEQMNNRAETENLLADVLAENVSPEFRAAALAATLRAARRRRQFRQLRKGAGIFCAVVLLAVVGKNFLKPPAVPAPQVKAVPKSSYELVRTQPLPAKDIVSTKSFSEIQIVSSSAATVMEIATTRGNFRRINDAELLALVAGNPAILIRTGPDSEELVFANPEDRKGFPAN